MSPSIKNFKILKILTYILYTYRYIFINVCIMINIYEGCECTHYANLKTSEIKIRVVSITLKMLFQLHIESTISTRLATTKTPLTKHEAPSNNN